MADEVSLGLRHGGDRRQNGDRRRTPRPTPDRRKRQRRGRFVRTGALVWALTLAGGFRGTLPRAGVDTPLRLPLDAFREFISVKPVPPLTLEHNSAVETALRQYHGQPFFAEALARGARYLPDIRRIFAAEGVPEELAYVALVESEFKPDALSWAKALGMWQFMPLTGERFGLVQDRWIDERKDPERATRAAAQYLRTLHNMFGDWNLALAAYNSGEGTVMRAIRRTGTRDFWKLARMGALPQETRLYVPRIHAAIHVARDPASYDLSVTPEAAPATEVVPIEDAVDLRLVAGCVGEDVEEIWALNPELRRAATPVGRDFALKVPEGMAEEVGACLARIPVGRRLKLHVVRRGETLSKVARLYGTSVDEIVEANSLQRTRSVPRGTELIIPANEEH